MRATGVGFVAKGEPEVSVSEPLEESMEYTDIVPEVSLATKRKLPPESMTSDTGVIPAGVRGMTSVSAPVLLSILRREIFPSLWLAT